MLNRGRHSVYSLSVHLIFVCKRRGKVFNVEHLGYLRGVFETVLDKFEAKLVEFNGEGDHVHLLVSYPPKHSVSSLTNSLKGVSSRLLKQAYPELEKFLSIKKSKNVLWSPRYFASSGGGAPLEVLKQYIRDQESPP